MECRARPWVSWMAAAAVMLGCMVGPKGLWGAEPYKIGGVFSITGSSSFLGDPEKKSLEMAVEEINAQGGIDGRPVEAVIYDTEGDPTKAVLAVNKLISKDNVLAIIGPSLTPTTLAVMPIVERVQVPLISCAAGIQIVEPVKPYVFKTAQSDVLAVATIYKHMHKHGIKKIGILSVTNAFGVSGRDQLVKQAPEYGIKIVKEEAYGANDTDMTAQLTKIKGQNPDAVVCWGTNPGPAVVAKNMRQLGLTFALYQSHGVASPKFIELAGEAAEGIRLPTGKILVADLLPASDPQKAVLTRYIAEYTKRYGGGVSGFGGYAYDAMHMLAKALKGTGGDKAKIRDNLEKISGHVGITGVFTMTAQDHNGLGPDAFVMVEIRNGTWKLLD